MWKPASVIRKHRKRATIVWVVLLAVQIAYGVWQVTGMLRKRENPSTSLTVSNDLYSFPNVEVCLSRYGGCTWADEGNIYGCVTSALESSTLHYEDQRLFPTLNEKTDNCLFFNMTDFNVTIGESKSENSVNDRATAYLHMDWITSDDISLEANISPTVDIYLSNGVNGSEEYLRARYSRNVFPSVEATSTYEDTVLGIGRTERKYLKKDTRITTPVLTISSLPFVFEEGGDLSDDTSPSSSTSLVGDDSWTYWSQLDDDSFTFLESPAANYSTGTLFLQLRQASYSHTIIEDVDPLDVANILGNIGGFFGYVLFFFSVFFTVAEPEKLPQLKARAFYTKSGTQVMRRQLSNGSNSRLSWRSSRSVSENGEQTPEDLEDEAKSESNESKQNEEVRVDPALPSGSSTSSTNDRPTMVEETGSLGDMSDSCSPPDGPRLVKQPGEATQSSST